MLFLVQNVLLWSMLLAISTAFPTSDLALVERSVTPSSVPLPPSQDPFYTGPAAYESKPPGTILRIRPAPGNLTTLTANCSAVYNILYRTTDSQYRPSWAMTTLFVPSNSSAGASNKSGGLHALLSYQIPYNTADVDFSPSFALYTQISSFTDIPAALGQGWYVSVPDFEGPRASFALGIQEGHATLDSVRAALSSHIGGLTHENTRYAMWGYSGGSIASEWAAELQPQYAPELTFSGAALGGVVSNFTSVMRTTPGTIWAGLLPPSILGLVSQDTEAQNWLISQLKTSGPYNRTGFLAVTKMSYNEEVVVYANQSIFTDYFVDGAAVLNHPSIRHIINNNGVMGYHGIPQMPLFVYKAIRDEITPIADTDLLVSRYCELGVDIIYSRNRIGGHLADYTNGDLPAFEWLATVLDGTYQAPPAGGCIIRDVSWNVTDSPA